MKKITACLSIIIVAAMLFSMMPLNVFAAGSTESSSYSEQGSTADASVTNNNLTVSGNNSFGDLLTEVINNAGDNDSPVEGYSVTGITMDGKTATVEYNAVSDCLLIVAVYTDDGIRMLGSGKKTVSAQEKTAEVPVSIDEMPQYYLLKAFLVNPENYNPLSNAFTCELYTQSIQEVVNSSIDDYEGREVLNLDGNDDTNFAVYNKKVSVIGESAGSNIYQPAASDPDSGKYVFANADSDFTSLKAGGLFSYTSGDELIIGKVRSISVTHNADGTDTVTVKENSDIELTDVFDYVKIENDGKIDGYELDDSAADEGLSDINASVRGLTKGAGISIEDSADFVDIQKHIHKEKSFSGQSSHSSDEGNVVLDADFKLKITFNVTAYASFENCYIDMSINSDATMNGTVTGSASMDITLPEVSSRFAGGSVKVGFVPKLKFSASAEITVDASFAYKVGFNCSTSDGLVNTSDEKPTFTLNVKVEGELYFGVEMTPSVTFIEAGVGQTKHYLAKLTVPMEVGLKTTGELKYPSDHACQKCIDGEFYLRGKITPSVKLLVKKSFSSESAKKEYSKPLLDKDFKVGDWYYSIDHNKLGMGECPYKDEIIDSGKCGDDITYTLYKSGLLELNGSGEMYDFGDEWGGVPSPWYNNTAIINQLIFIGEITSIGSYAFLECGNVNNIQIPESIITIGHHAFYACTGLNEIEIPCSVTSIGSGAFTYCTNLKNLVIPSSVTSISSGLFSECSGLENISIPQSISSIGEYAFIGCASLRSVMIPNSVESIGYSAFGECTGLTSVTVPTTVSSIGNNIFDGCTGLKSATVGNVSKKMFNGCSSLINVTVQESAQYISQYAFYNCINLKIINIPHSMQQIHLDAFYGCTSFTDIYYIGSEADWKKIGDGEYVSYGNTYGATLHPSIIDVVIPNTVTKIDDFEYSSCSLIRSITIPDSVTEIGKFAFYGCTGLTSITIPNSVTKIGGCAFAGCTGLTSVNIPVSVNSFDEYIFEGCTGLKSATVINVGNEMFTGCTSLESVIVQYPARYISIYAFNNCSNLKRITVPKSMRSIAFSAFSGCTSFTDIYYVGSETDWQMIYDEDYVSCGNTYGATIHYNCTMPSSSPVPVRSAGNSGTKSAAITDLVPIESYLFVVSKSSDTENMLDPENLLYIDQMTAGEDGTLTAVYEPREEVDGASVKAFGPVKEAYAITASPDSPQKVGTPVTLTAEGGSSYRFYYEQNGKSVTVRDFAAENTCVWTPTALGDYILYVDIRDENDQLVAVKGIKYTVTDAYSFTLDKENEQNVGVNMTLTAEGGASYKFYYEYNGAWCNITSNTTGVCEWSPKYAGNYMLYVDIKDETGKVIACRTQEFKLNDPFTLTSDAESAELPYGKTINFTADGGTSYKFYYEKQGEWVRVQDFSAVSTCAWTPTEAGKYNFYCDIKDTSGKVVSCKRMTFTITNPYSFTADKETTQPVGKEIGFTATGGYQYKFYYEKDGSWVRIQSFSTANTCAWTPTVAGRYNVYCDIADENGTVLAYKGIEFVIGNAGTTDYTFITSVESPQPMNTSVILSATGGASYKFYYEVGGKWATVQNFSTANTATWTPDMIADYTLYVDIKNSSGKVVKTISKKFSATDPYSFTADTTSPQNIGKSVKLTATGGASYKFYYQYAGAWVKIQDSTSETCNWKPNKAGEYMVYVDIKNASGAVLTCRTMKLVFNDPYRFTTSASSLTQPAGTAISLSANGGTSYKFYYEKNGTWVRIQDYSTTKTCTWTPTEAGKYNVFCDIKDASGSVAVCKRITFTITEKCTITASKTNASVGDTITFTATGGSSYKFYYEKDGAWVRIQSFSTSNTCNWKPTAAGDYVVYVDVNDANGNLIGCKGVRCVVG